MTSRFEVEEIVEQDAVAVVFKALDHETEQQVALRRVGGEKGLAFVNTGAEGKQVFHEIVELLATAEGEGIRKVITGGVDDVDGAPWVAYEWFEEKSFVHEPDFKTTSKELREDAIEAVLKCLIVLHSTDLLGGWIGFENLFLKAHGTWVVELCPERMAIAKVGGVEVDHPFASESLKAAEKSSALDDLRGVAEFLAMLKKGTTTSEKTALPSEWMRFFGWLKKDEKANAAEALERVQKIRNPDVLSAVAEIRRKNRAITSSVQSSADPSKATPPLIAPTPAPGTITTKTGKTLLTTSAGHITQSVPTTGGAPIGASTANLGGARSLSATSTQLTQTAPSGKGKLSLILGLLSLLIFGGLGAIVLKKSSQFSGQKKRETSPDSETQKDLVTEAQRIKERKESIARGEEVIIDNEKTAPVKPKRPQSKRKPRGKKKGRGAKKGNSAKKANDTKGL